MTALALDHGGALPLSPAPDPVTRPRLRLVSADERVPLVAPRPRLRLTRRARLLRTLVGAFLLASAVLVLAAHLRASEPLVADHATTVRPGQTLSSLAAEQLPGVPVADGVAMIVRLNGLASPEVPAGRTLLLPSI